MSPLVQVLQKRWFLGSTLYIQGYDNYENEFLFNWGIEDNEFYIMIISRSSIQVLVFLRNERFEFFILL